MLYNLSLHILTALKVMTINLWFIMTRSDSIAVRFVLYTCAMLWGIQIYLTPSFHYIAMAETLRLSESTLSWVIAFLPFGLVVYGLVSMLTLLLKLKNRSFTILSSIAGAFFFTLALNLEMVIHYLNEGSFIPELPIWYASFMAMWILVRDIIRGNKNGS